MNAVELKQLLKPLKLSPLVRAHVRNFATISTQKYVKRTYVKDEQSGRIIQTRTPSDGVAASFGPYTGFGTDLDGAVADLASKLWTEPRRPPTLEELAGINAARATARFRRKLDFQGVQTGRVQTEVANANKTPTPAVEVVSTVPPAKPPTVEKRRAKK